MLLFLIRLGVALGVFLLTLGLHQIVLRRRGHVRPLFGAVQRAHWHIPHTIGAAALLTGWVLALVFPHSGAGGISGFSGSLRPSVPLGGLAAPRTLLAYAPAIYDQGQSNACGAHAAVTSLQVEARERGEDMPSLSPWYVYQFSGRCSNSYTSLDGNAAAIASYGVAPQAWLPGFACPGSWSNARDRGGRYWYLFNGQYGADYAGRSIAGSINAGYAPLLLMKVYSGFMSAYGASSTDDQGWSVGTHWVSALGWRWGSSGIEVLIQNSYGSLWGQGGRIWLSATALGSVIAAGVIAPGVQQWPSSRARVAAVPSRAPRAALRYRVVVGHYLRVRPVAGRRSGTFVSRGALLVPTGHDTAHWRGVRFGGVVRYAWRANVRAVQAPVS